MKMFRGLLFVLAICLVSVSSNAQGIFYGAKYINSIDSVFLLRVMNMEKQKDSEITVVVFYSKHERQQLANLEKFLKNPYAPSIVPLDFTIIQSAFDKYYQAAKIQLLYDLDITTQPTKVLGFTVQPYKAICPASYAEPVLSAGTQSCYSSKPFRPEPTIAYIANMKEMARTQGELRIFFPETFKMLHYADPAETFPDFGTLYKTMFTRDLRKIFPNVWNYILSYPANAVPDIETSFLKEHNISMIRNGDGYFPFKVSEEILDKITRGYDAVGLINELDYKYYDPSLLDHAKKSTGDQLAIAFHALNLIQSALRDTVTATPRRSANWITEEQFATLQGNEKRYFYGMMYQRDPKFFNAYLGITTPFPESDYIKSLEPLIFATLHQLGALQDFVNAGNLSGNRGNYRDFMKVNLDLFVANPFVPAELKPYFALNGDLMTVYENAFSGNYQTNLYYTLKIVNELQQSKQEFSKEMHNMEQVNKFMLDIASTSNQADLEEVLKKYVPKK